MFVGVREGESEREAMCEREWDPILKNESEREIG